MTLIINKSLIWPLIHHDHYRPEFNRNIKNLQPKLPLFLFLLLSILHNCLIFVQEDTSLQKKQIDIKIFQRYREINNTE